MAFPKRFVRALVAATLLAPFVVAAPSAAAQGPRNAEEFAAWCRSQGLGVSYNPPRCVAAPASPGAARPGANQQLFGTRPFWLPRRRTPEERLQRQQQREQHRQRQHLDLQRQGEARQRARQHRAELRRQRDDETCASPNPNLAIPACNALIRSGRSSAQTLAVYLSNRGHTYYRQRDYARGRADFNEALRLSPQNAAAHNGLGHIYSGQGDNVRALASYEAALRIEPQSAAARVGRDRAAAQLSASQPASAAGGQTNAGALTAEGRAAAAAPPGQGLVRANGALEQARIAGTGAVVTSRVFDGGTGPSDGRAAGAIVVPPTPQPVDVTRLLSPAEVTRYSGARGFSEANRAVEEARLASEQAEARRAELTRQAGLTTDAAARAQIQPELAQAEQAASVARAAQRIAGTQREEIIRVVGAPIIEEAP